MGPYQGETPDSTIMGFRLWPDRGPHTNPSGFARNIDRSSRVESGRASYGASIATHRAHRRLAQYSLEVRLYHEIRSSHPSMRSLIASFRLATCLDRSPSRGGRSRVAKVRCCWNLTRRVLLQKLPQPHWIKLEDTVQYDIIQAIQYSILWYILIEQHVAEYIEISDQTIAKYSTA